MLQIDLALVVVVLTIVVFVAVIFAADYGRRSPGAFPFMTWIGLTLATIVAGAMASFVAVNVLVFTLGPGAGMAGLVLSGVGFVATPVAWAVILRRRSHHASADR